MLTLADKPQDDSSIPQIVCPVCGSEMRLAMAESIAPDNRMTFDCPCGFEYQLSEKVARERQF